MSIRQIHNSYVPAEVRTGKITRVVYYIEHPATKVLTQKVVKCNRLKSKRLNLEFARKIAQNLNHKLADGYNPFIEVDSGRGYAKMVDAVELFLKEKTKELRKDSMRSYNSQCQSIINYLQETNNENMCCVLFSKQHAMKYLEIIYARDKMSNTTWNNYLKFCRTLFNWLLDKEYCKVNFFEKIQVKKKEAKKREVLSTQQKLKLQTYLQKYDPNFWAICSLCYGCFIRPKEILSLHPSDFILSKRLIRIRANVAKNGKERMVVIPDMVLEALLNINLDKIEEHHFVFSWQWKPGKKQLSSREIGKYWTDLRPLLNFPMEVSFYSLKDTGITDMLDSGISPKVVQQHADHSSIEMTEKYNHKNFDLYKSTILNNGIDFNLPK